MNGRRRFGMVVVLLSLCCILSSTQPARVQTASPAAVANPLAAPSLNRLSATRERPLFTPSRRAAPPPPVASAAPAESVASPPQIALLGVIIAVEGPRAVINDMASNKIVRVRIGDEIDGWKVRQIDERLLVLWRDGRSASFKLFNGERVKPSGQTVNAANKQPEPGPHQPHRPRSD